MNFDERYLIYGLVGLVIFVIIMAVVYTFIYMKTEKGVIKYKRETEHDKLKWRSTQEEKPIKLDSSKLKYK